MKELIAIQSELKANKTQYNNFGKYHYRSNEDILEALKPLLAKYECLLTLNDSIENIGDRYYVKTIARIINSKGIAIETTAYAREADTRSGMDSSQLTGSCSSYASKYCLGKLFLIDDNRDADTMPPSGNEKPQPKVEVKTEIKSEPKTDLAPCDMGVFEKMTKSAKEANTPEKKQAVLDRAVNNYSLSNEQLALLTSLCK